MIKTSKTTEKKTRSGGKGKSGASTPAVNAAPETPAVKAAPSVAPAAKKTAVEPSPTASSGVRLDLIFPEAKSVAVAGSFNAWKPETTPLQPAGDGRWTGSLKVNPGRYEYLLVVDGKWVPDPNAKEAVQNPYGGCNSVLVVKA